MNLFPNPCVMSDARWWVKMGDQEVTEEVEPLAADIRADSLGR